MPPYFKPLRRKIGVVTLATGCMFAGAWIRSSSSHDRVAFHTSSRTYHYLRSDRDGLEWSKMTDYSDSDQIQPIAGISDRISFTTKVYDDAAAFEAVNEYFIGFQRRRWRFDWLGVQFGPTGYGKIEITSLILPHWFVVIPLTLLSVWLLLGRSRVKKVGQTARAPDR